MKKKLASVQEVEGEGLLALMGQKVTLFCMNYFYTGTLAGVNSSCVLLEDPKIVYETGEWSEKGYADAQALPTKSLYVQIASIESFAVLK